MSQTLCMVLEPTSPHNITTLIDRVVNNLHCYVSILNNINCLSHGTWFKIAAWSSTVHKQTHNFVTI